MIIRLLCGLIIFCLMACEQSSRDPARERLENIGQIIDREKAVRDEQIALYMDAAQVAFEKAEFLSAKAAVDKAHAVDPEHKRMRSMRLKVYAVLGKSGTAVTVMSH